MIIITAMRNGPGESLSVEALEDGRFKLRIDNTPCDSTHHLSAEIVLSRQHAQFLRLLLGADGQQTASPES